MPAGFCSIDFCVKPTVKAACWCEEHDALWASSPEMSRGQPSGWTNRKLVSALVDFRTRIELEHQRDLDPAVIAARGGK